MQPHSAHLPTSQARAASDSANISRGTSSQLQQEDNQQPLSFRVQQQAHTGSERIYYEAGRPAGETLNVTGAATKRTPTLGKLKPGTQYPGKQGARPRQTPDYPSLVKKRHLQKPVAPKVGLLEIVGFCTRTTGLRDPN